MSVILILVPLALLLAAAALIAFACAARQGQFDDLDTPALRVINDDGAVSAHRASTRRCAQNQAKK
jgi:cbb3-type cytochrome oxidase maturation protein